jgi:putative heme-binding domain-containing protein
LTALLARSDRIGAVLDALEGGQITTADLSSAQANFLRTHRDAAISRRALQLFGAMPRWRPDAVERFQPSLSLPGAASRGRGIFLARCTACHSLDREAQALGPELVSAKIYGNARILRAILEPNVDVRPDYATYALETADGEILIGRLRNENSTAVTLQQPNGVTVVLPRANLRSLEAQPWSLMPEKMEEGLTQQDMADLLEYVLRPIATP